jgi:hypothetical protein
MVTTKREVGAAVGLHMRSPRNGREGARVLCV